MLLSLVPAKTKFSQRAEDSGGNHRKDHEPEGAEDDQVGPGAAREDGPVDGDSHHERQEPGTRNGERHHPDEDRYADEPASAFDRVSALSAKWMASGTIIAATTDSSSGLAAEAAIRAMPDRSR